MARGSRRGARHRPPAGPSGRPAGGSRPQCPAGAVAAPGGGADAVARGSSDPDRGAFWRHSLGRGPGARRDLLKYPLGPGAGSRLETGGLGPAPAAPAGGEHPLRGARPSRHHRGPGAGGGSHDRQLRHHAPSEHIDPGAADAGCPAGAQPVCPGSGQSSGHGGAHHPGHARPHRHRHPGATGASGHGGQSHSGRAQPAGDQPTLATAPANDAATDPDPHAPVPLGRRRLRGAGR